MAVIKYKDPKTGEVKKVGAPPYETYTKPQIDAKVETIDSKVTQVNNVIEKKAPAFNRPHFSQESVGHL